VNKLIGLLVNCKGNWKIHIQRIGFGRNPKRKSEEEDFGEKLIKRFKDSVL
jgi:hypothetical protein